MHGGGVYIPGVDWSSVTFLINLPAAGQLQHVKLLSNGLQDMIPLFRQLGYCALTPTNISNNYNLHRDFLIKKKKNDDHLNIRDLGFLLEFLKFPKYSI